MTLPTSGEWTICTEATARDRFEGEHQVKTWPRKRDAEVPCVGYAPSKYLRKQWPQKAQLKVWYSLCREVRVSFRRDVPTPRYCSLPLVPHHHHRPVSRDWSSWSAAAVNAKDPPGANGEHIRDVEGSALDTAFPKGPHRAAVFK